jgi:hypothetical protein
MKKLFWPPEAVQDRDDIYQYIEADNPVAALALMSYLQKRPAAWSIIPAWASLAVLPALVSW